MTVVDTVDVDKVIQQAKQSIKSNQAHQNLQRKKYRITFLTFQPSPSMILP